MAHRAVPVLALVVALCGCRVFDETLIATDAGTMTPDVVEMPDTGRSPACPLRVPPARPDVPVTEDTGEVVLVVQGWSIDQRDERWREIGYDLDGLCTQAPEIEVECVPPSPSAPPEVDGEGGIDNALGHNLFNLLLFAFPELEQELNEVSATGVGNIVVSVRAWNGAADDSRVDVFVTQSAQASSALPDGGAPPLEMADEMPRWDGSDWFWVRGDSFLDDDLSRPRFRLDNAYVSGGLLVVRVPDRIPITFSSSWRGFRATITGGVMTVPMPLEEITDPKATIAGRFPIVDLLDTIQHAGFCVGSEDYRTFERLTDLAADIRVDPTSGGPGVTCDAISLGLQGNRFTGRIAGISTRLGYPNACADAGTPPDAGPMDAGPADGGDEPDAGT